nr:phosphoribosylformylglycinamidine synthase-associated small membrane protein [uncultured Cohaesibacter sp.]
MSDTDGTDTVATSHEPEAFPARQSQSHREQAPEARYNQKEEAAKAIRFMLIKAAIFILIPVFASALAIFILL